MVCQFCGQALGEQFLSRHLCPSCGQPQPVKADENYFLAFDATERFSQDLNLLQKRFYEVSRALHPDRFAAADDDTRKRSLDRMSFINEAYRTLRTPAELRDYILELRGLKTPESARGQIPMQLAESWFDLQDALAEDPDQALAKLKLFENELLQFRQSADSKIKSSENQFDEVAIMSRSLSQESEQQTILKKMGREIQELSYLKSLDRDVERIKARLTSN